MSRARVGDINFFLLDHGHVEPEVFYQCLHKVVLTRVQKLIRRNLLHSFFQQFLLPLKNAEDIRAYLEVGQSLRARNRRPAARRLASISRTLGRSVYDPSQDCARGDAEFPGQLGQVPVTKA
jgi:hypothetical protein